MAKNELRIRFVIGHQGGGVSATTSRQRLGQNFANAIVKDFAFRYAEDTYKTMARQIEVQLQRDIRRELTHLAALFRHHIIGSKRDRPRGTLDTLSGSDQLVLASAVPSWAPRSQRYLEYKQRTRHHQDWWSSSGRLSAAMTSDNWISAFGPISVQFRRSSNPAGSSRQFGAGPAQAKEGFNPARVRVQVGTLRVQALTNITPSMLPGLASGNPRTPIPTTPNDGLMLLVQSGMGDDIAYRLGRTSSSGQYRPTLEPFLTFFLTRSVPSAIARRLEIGGLARARGSGGRLL